MKKFLTVITAALMMAAAYGQTESDMGFKWVRTLHEDAVRPYSEGVAAYCVNGEWGYMDTYGTPVIAPTFDDARSFRYGVALVSKDSKWGVINRSGYVIIPIQYDSIEQFSDNTALAVKDGRTYYLYSSGQIRELPGNIRFHSYSNGIAKVMKTSRKGDRYGFIDNDKGYYVIEPRYDNASDFQGEFAIVSRKGRTYIINRNERKFKVHGNISVDGTSLSPESGSGFIRKEDGTYNLLRKERNTFTEVPTSYSKANPFHEGLALVNSGGSLRFINPSGAIAIDLSGYDNAGNFSDGLAWVESNGKYGYIDTKGRLVIDTVFSLAGDFSEGFATASYQERRGIIKKAALYDTYPRLAVSSVKLSDGNGNSTVEPGEPFRYSVTIENSGDEAASGVSAALAVAGGRTDLTIESAAAAVPVIYSGESETVTFSGRAGSYLSPGEIPLNISVTADNLLGTVTDSRTIKSGAASRSRLVIASYRVFTPDDTPIQKGKDIRLEIYIRNEGQDVARNSSVRLRLPDGVSAKSIELSAGNVAPGQSARVTTLLEVDEAEAQNIFSIITSVSEMSKKQSDVKFVSFEIGKVSSSVNFLLQ